MSQRTHHRLGFETPEERTARLQRQQERADQAAWARPFVFHGEDLRRAIAILEKGGRAYEMRGPHLHTGTDGQADIDAAVRDARYAVAAYGRATGADVSSVLDTLPRFAKVEHRAPGWASEPVNPNGSRAVRRPVLRGVHELFVDGEIVHRDGRAVGQAVAA